MCTVVILRRPGHDWPLVLAANRDEMANRAWEPPARHWPDRPHVVAGHDKQAGGSWMGVNDDGVAAAILNRAGTLGSLANKRTRGELVLEALDHADASAAAEAMSGLDPDAYRPFNLIVADNTAGFWLAHRGDGKITVTAIPEDVSMITEGDLNDFGSNRVGRHLSRFRDSMPDGKDWRDWENLLTDRATDPALGPASAMRIERGDGFGTVSHSVLALPAAGSGRHPIWRFATAGALPPEWTDIETR